MGVPLHRGARGSFRDARGGKVRGIDLFAAIMIRGREQMSKGTSMKKEQKKPKKKG
jgi:hypothetical protein